MSLQVGAPTLHSKPLVNQTASWRKLTHRIGLIEVAAKESDLTSTPATINFAQGATVARFREPFRASKSRKGRTVRPNPGQTPFRHVVERQAWNLRCGLAGQNISPWIHRQAAAAPAVQACLRPSLIKLQGHRPIVTAHRDGFSHDRRSLALGAIGHVWEANALACNAIEETCSRTALFREKTCLSSDRKAQFSLNRMLDGASERICPCFTRS